MKLADLDPEQRGLLAELADFDLEFWQVADWVHWGDESAPLPQKYAKAQELVAGLLASGIVRCVVVREVERSRSEELRRTAVPQDKIFEAWHSPWFWARGRGAALLGVEDPSAVVAIEPTDVGASLLDEMFGR